MEIIKNLTTETLTQSQTTYDFEDLFVNLNGELIIIKGSAEIDFREVGDYIVHPFGFEPEPTYEIANIEIEISKAYSKDSEERLLSEEESKTIKNEITQLLKVQTIERH